MYEFLSTITDPNHWRKLRKDYMDSARACKATLTHSDGFWKLSPNDKQVKEAVGAWVARARNCHAFALSRKPIMNYAIVVTPQGGFQGGISTIQP